MVSYIRQISSTFDSPAFRHCGVFLAISLLMFASGSKLERLSSGNGSLTWSGIAVLELLLAIWLTVNLFHKVAVATTIFVFAIFLLSNVYLGYMNDVTCQCFGEKSVSLGTMQFIDGFTLTLLVAGWKHNRSHSTQGFVENQRDDLMKIPKQAHKHQEERQVFAINFYALSMGIIFFLGGTFPFPSFSDVSSDKSQTPDEIVKMFHDGQVSSVGGNQFLLLVRSSCLRCENFKRSFASVPEDIIMASLLVDDSNSSLAKEFGLEVGTTTHKLNSYPICIIFRNGVPSCLFSGFESWQSIE